MANSGVHGRVVDETGAGIAGLIVGVFDVGGISGNRLLRNTASPTHPAFPEYGLTASDGSFTISYTDGTYDLIIRVFDSVRRQVGISPQLYLKVSDVLFELPAPIEVMRADASGLLVSSGYSPSLIAGNSVEALVDNREAWKRVLASVDAAQTSIDWLLFYLDIEKVFMTFPAVPTYPAPQPPTTTPVIGARLEVSLQAAGQRGVRVRLLCNQLVLGRTKAVRLPYPTNTAARVETFFTTPPSAGVEVRRFATPAYAPIHTKIVIIDNKEAFVLGSPFVHDYYDAFTHLIADPRHGFFFDFPCSSAAIRVPTHDVSLRIRGPVIGGLNDTFALHWNLAAPTGTAAIAPDPAPPAETGTTVSVQMTRSLTGNTTFVSLPRGETTILESYLRAIHDAKQYIYLENQYFTCDEIADALVFALKDTSRPQLQVIFLTNNAVDIPGYSKWQPALINKVLGALGEDEKRRIGFFTIWSHEDATTVASDDPRPQICRNYIHSKVAIVDDVWATVGSANLDGDSLTRSDNAVRGIYWLTGGLFSLRTDLNPEENRESETNLVVYGGTTGGSAGQAGTDFAVDLRRQLWAEHLGFKTPTGEPDVAAPELAAAPSDGWLELWNARATDKVDGLRDQPYLIKDARVLPFPPTISEDGAEPENFLRYSGIDPEQLFVWKRFRRYRWDPGDWWKYV